MEESHSGEGLSELNEGHYVEALEDVGVPLDVEYYSSEVDQLCYFVLVIDYQAVIDLPGHHRIYAATSCISHTYDGEGLLPSEKVHHRNNDYLIYEVA